MVIPVGLYGDLLFPQVYESPRPSPLYPEITLKYAI